MLHIDGYNHHINNIEDPSTRGCLIYVKEKFESTPVDLGQHGFKDAIWVSVKGCKAKEKILIGCIYRSGTPNTAISNDENMYTMLNTASKLTGYHSKVIAGDFNLNKITWNPDPITPDILSHDSPAHMSPMVRKGSRKVTPNIFTEMISMNPYDHQVIGGLN